MSVSFRSLLFLCTTPQQKNTGIILGLADDAQKSGAYSLKGFVVVIRFQEIEESTSEVMMSFATVI